MQACGSRSAEACVVAEAVGALRGGMSRSEGGGEGEGGERGENFEAQGLKQAFTLTASQGARGRRGGGGARFLCNIWGLVHSGRAFCRSDLQEGGGGWGGGWGGCHALRGGGAAEKRETGESSLLKRIAVELGEEEGGGGGGAGVGGGVREAAAAVWQRVRRYQVLSRACSSST
jgi:hypothetical protein